MLLAVQMFQTKGHRMDAKSEITRDELECWTNLASSFLNDWFAEPLPDRETLQWIDDHQSSLANRRIAGDTYEQEGVFLLEPSDCETRRRYSQVQLQLRALAIEAHKRLTESTATKSRQPVSLRISPLTLDYQP